MSLRMLGLVMGRACDVGMKSGEGDFVRRTNGFGVEVWGFGV